MYNIEKRKRKTEQAGNNRCLLLYIHISLKKSLLHFRQASPLKFFFKAFSMPPFTEIFPILMKRVMYSSEDSFFKNSFLQIEDTSLL